MTIAELFRARRAATGWSLREAAYIIDIPHVRLGEIENGKHTNLTAKTLRQAQGAYEVSACDLWAAVCETIDIS